MIAPDPRDWIADLITTAVEIQISHFPIIAQFKSIGPAFVRPVADNDNDNDEGGRAA